MREEGNTFVEAVSCCSLFLNPSATFSSLPPFPSPFAPASMALRGRACLPILLLVLLGSACCVLGKECEARSLEAASDMLARRRYVHFPSQSGMQRCASAVAMRKRAGARERFIERRARVWGFQRALSLPPLLSLSLSLCTTLFDRRRAERRARPIPPPPSSPTFNENSQSAGLHAHSKKERERDQRAP